ETYRQLTLGTTSLWNQWRAALPTNGRVSEVADSRLRAAARAADSHLARTRSQTRIAKKLFRELRHAGISPALLDGGADLIMPSAAGLHGIEPKGSRKRSEKDARKFLARLPLPPGWTSESWQLLSLAVRYHRGAAPSAERGRFAKLEAAQQAKLLFVIGI